MAVNRPARRGVTRAMTNEEWKAALEQQIREREEQRTRQCGASTGTDSTTTSTSPKLRIESGSHDHEGMANDEGNRIGVARHRRVVQQQSREEYLKSLEEQIQEKKRQEQDATNEAERASRARRLLMRARRRKPSDCEETDSMVVDKVQKTTQSDPLVRDGDAEISWSHTPMKCEQPEADYESTSLQQDENQQIFRCVTPTAPSTASSSAASIDAAALTKLIELCEGMKQQNEELKQQLRQQQSVLATLTTKDEPNTLPASKYTVTDTDRLSSHHQGEQGRRNQPKTLLQTVSDQQNHGSWQY